MVRAARRVPDPDRLRWDAAAAAGPVTPDQVKAARSLLGWSQLQLGLRSDTSVNVVKKFEQNGRAARVQRRPDLTDALAAVRATLEAAGIEFTGGAVPGVRLRQQGS